MAVTWSGLDQFKHELRNLPEHLAGEAEAIVFTHAQEAERQVRAAYPEGPTGNLRRGVRTAYEGGRAGATAIVRSAAKHAHLFEKGTARRQTHKGANRGAMPAADPSEQMIPIVIRVRRRMVAQLIALVQRAGLTVTSS